ncbi:type II secretion system F family protein [Arthrobacter sp. NPDC090010]|uniref:type II secretion system F family protein n=1 Tax=Arthrobacter sp. NPDC090010 TaxID=3363942 RepID=UPI0037FB2A04
MLLELAGVLLEAGLSVHRCLDVLSDSTSHEDISVSLGKVSSALNIGTGWGAAWRLATSPVTGGLSGGRLQRALLGRHRPRGTAMDALQLLERHLGFVAHSGAPSAGILFAAAAAERRRRFRDAERRAAALGVRLVVPLGLCSLPSFVCLGIVPLVLALLPGAA